MASPARPGPVHGSGRQEQDGKIASTTAQDERTELRLHGPELQCSTRELFGMVVGDEGSDAP